jgi:catechol 2,3-dioxygenase-like lactoylglutathione lyase family enzyme
VMPRIPAISLLRSLSAPGVQAPGMEQRLTMVTLGVADLDVSRRFYLEGLGWTPLLDAGEAVFLQVGRGVLLALYGRADLAREAGTADVDGPPAPLSLAHNVGSEEEVRAVVAQLRSAGGRVVAEPARAPWGGYTAYVADPDGFRWEVAYNPGLVVDDDGSVRFGSVDEPR